MGKRFLSVETNACATKIIPYPFCTPPIGRQTGLAAVGTLSAVIYVTYFVRSRSLFVFEQFALIKFFLCTSSSLCPLPLSSILCPLTLSSSGHSAGFLRTFRWDRRADGCGRHSTRGAHKRSAASSRWSASLDGG